MTRRYMSMVVVISILSVLAVFPVSPAHAATITVTSQLDIPDPGKCRLRDAISAANTNTAAGDCPAGTAGMDTIGFSLGIQCQAVPCTITLTGALPTVTEDLTINGSNTIISGANSFRVFDLGVVIVNMADLTIAHGNAVGNFGGAINMSGALNMPGTTLTLSNVFFSNNHAVFGGAIFAPRGTLTVSHCTFSGNSAEIGGAIHEERNDSLVVIVDSVFSNNTAADNGGALALVSDAIISDSTFSGNSASFGGAIAKVVLGDMQLTDSVFYDNVATITTTLLGGGAIYIGQSEGAMSLTNVTLSGNSAVNHGGGIAANLATLSLNNVTISNNTADSDNDGAGEGGGIFRGTSTVQVQNSIIAGNFDTPGSAGGGTINPDCSGTFSSQGYNLIGRSDGCSGFVNGLNADKVGTGASPIDPLLGALANNGGSTHSHALLPGSPALNAGNPLPPGSGGFACAANDQRGVARPQSSACDIGAFELEFRSLYLPLILR